ncbi:hypothetical protein A3D54_02835 [Candidatus Falkowbacteria bacterium RIFCSPHIGHO2_02_FULL_45_15]|uniref:Uncharacterized protein n=1 Tax=Candidatus Falkowbacteria bacterium RIFCSPHIGHO2_02_FULL_45_15 TaxID=1797987 RepID=A0A1F5RXJ8_9BACT|nr:MAG: hypothetical protein A3D54_02835 [Candidatus Falkowbacteria bacterium RIFCSPHIGHO2_02_FULL_45_15]
MKKFIKSRIILQVITATLVTTLTTTGIVLAATTINNNISTGTIDATGLSTLTSATLSSTLAVTGATTLSDDLTIDTSDLFVDVSTDRIGVGSTTPWATLSIDTNAGDNAFVIGSSTATYLRVDTNGVLRGNESAGDSADLRWDGTTNTYLLFADVSAEKIGIGSSTPYAQFSLNAEAGMSALTIGSSTATLLEVNSSGNLLVDTNTLVTDRTNNRIGVATTTPSATFAVGSGTATSTIDLGKPCFRIKTAEDTQLYYWPSVAAGMNVGGWATSTTSCF